MKTIKDLYDEALAEKEKALKKIEPLREREAELMAEIDPLEAELRKTREAIVKAERETGLADISRKISALAPAQKRTVAETGGIGVK